MMFNKIKLYNIYYTVGGCYKLNEKLVVKTILFENALFHEMKKFFTC